MTTTAVFATAVRTVPGWTLAPSITEHGSHEHGLNTTVGYSIVRTCLDTSVAVLADSVTREQVEVLDGAGSYADALTRVCSELAEIDQHYADALPFRYHAVIDTLYACGCRSDRVNA